MKRIPNHHMKDAKGDRSTELPGRKLKKEIIMQWEKRKNKP